MSATASTLPLVMPRSRFWSLLPWLGFGLLLLAVPVLFPSRTALTIFNAVGINIVFALSYNMLLGQGGMLSFGHAVYYGLGGYAAIHLMAALKPLGLPIPVFALPLVGFAAGLLAGAIIGWPSCRRAGTPFAMISLGIGELIAAAGFMFKTLFGGEEGLSGDRSVGPVLFGLKLTNAANVAIFIAFWVLVASFAMWAFTRTPLGRLSNAVRDNPDRVKFIGFDPSRVRYLVFIIAGGFAGLAGGMSAVNFEIMTPEALGALPSAAVLLMAYIGGVGIFYGPIIGAILLTITQSMLSDYTKVWQLYVGLVFMAVVMFAPGGIAGILEMVRRTWNRGDLANRLPVWLVGIVGFALLGFGCIILIELIVRLKEAGKPLALLGFLVVPKDVLGWAMGICLALGGFAVMRAAKRLDAGATKDAAT
jgi:branched-chain amino acid transport system permease protein